MTGWPIRLLYQSSDGIREIGKGRDDGGVGYYNIYYRTFATSTGVTTFDPTSTDSNYQSPSAAAALWSNTTVDPKSTAGNIGFSGTESIGAWASSTIASITGVVP